MGGRGANNSIQRYKRCERGTRYTAFTGPFREKTNYTWAVWVEMVKGMLENALPKVLIQIGNGEDNESITSLSRGDETQCEAVIEILKKNGVPGESIYVWVSEGGKDGKDEYKRDDELRLGAKVRDFPARGNKAEYLIFKQAIATG